MDARVTTHVMHPQTNGIDRYTMIPRIFNTVTNAASYVAPTEEESSPLHAILSASG